MTITNREIFERYVYAGAISRNPDAVADLFTEDGIYEAPLVGEGHALPRRLVGREAIRAGIGAVHRPSRYPGIPNIEQTRYVLHDTADAAVFVAELDPVFDHPETGTTSSAALVQIFRIRDGRIALLRDYFTVTS